MKHFLAPWLHLLLFWVLLIAINKSHGPGLAASSSEQETTQAAGRFTAGLTCYSCKFTYKNDPFDAGADDDDSWCTNATLLKKKRAEVERPCAPWESYCIITITATLNSFTTIKRDCSGKCDEECESTKFGNNQVSCTGCCQTSNCNSNHTYSYYKRLMQHQHTSWTKALEDEVKFNHKAKLRFPY